MFFFKYTNIYTYTYICVHTQTLFTNMDHMDRIVNVHLKMNSIYIFQVSFISDISPLVYLEAKQMQYVAGQLQY